MTGEQLRDLRLALSLSQREFAEMVGVGCSTIARIESGSQSMSLLTRAKIAQKIQFDDGLFIFVDKSQKLNRLIHNHMVSH
ncbi:helix-turn-helix transcriptional regulator [Lysinibacillus sp. RC79]|uniref:helix-turn-helix transcriptional regulator n=1 Tax=Lysinibacillus sp. RC79 TaxID=3156296 RepID=UPI003516DD3B